MSLYRSRPVQVFKFRTAFIHSIFSSRTQNEETVNDIVDQRYPYPNRDFDESTTNVVHHDAIREGLKLVGSNDNLQSQVREMANGINQSILSQSTSVEVLQDRDDQRGATSLRSVISYNIPEKYIGMFRNVDPYLLDESERMRLTKQARDTMALQGAEYIQYMYRLSGGYFRNDASVKSMYPTGMNNDMLGMYRVTLYADLAENQYKTFVDEITKTYRTTGIEPFGDRGIELYKQVPFVYLVVLFRPTSANAKATNIYIKFMEDLRSEYETYILPLQKQIPLTNLYPFHPSSVGSDFWTLKFIDKGFDDLSAKIAIRSYPDLFPTLDNDQLMKLWHRNNNEPSFSFEDKVEDLGQKYYDVLRTKLPGFSKDSVSVLRGASDRDIKHAFTQSDLVNCSLLDSKKCEYPLPWFIRDLFDASSRQSSDISIKNLVLFFVLSAERKLREKMKDEANAIFSHDKHKEMFPSSPTIAACVFIIVMSSCLSEYREQITWTSAKFESDRHTSPWVVLVEKALDMQGPLTTFPNYTGMRELIQSWDLMLFSFIGGYISAARDTKLATLWRKIRVALLRMTFLDTVDEKTKFLKNANMHGFTENLADFKNGLSSIQDNNIRRTELASYGAPSDKGREPEGHRDIDGTINPQIRTLSESEKRILNDLTNLKPHSRTPQESLTYLVTKLVEFVNPQRKTAEENENAKRVLDLIGAIEDLTKQSIHRALIPELYNALAQYASSIMKPISIQELAKQPLFQQKHDKLLAIVVGVESFGSQDLGFQNTQERFDKSCLNNYPTSYGMPVSQAMTIIREICKWFKRFLKSKNSSPFIPFNQDRNPRGVEIVKEDYKILVDFLRSQAKFADLLEHVHKYGQAQDGILQAAGIYLGMILMTLEKMALGNDYQTLESFVKFIEGKKASGSLKKFVDLERKLIDTATSILTNSTDRTTDTIKSAIGFFTSEKDQDEFSGQAPFIEQIVGISNKKDTTRGGGYSTSGYGDWGGPSSASSRTYSTASSTASSYSSNSRNFHHHPIKRWI